MKYQCDSCKRTFLHTAKLIMNEYQKPVIVESVATTDVKIMGPAVPITTTEFAVCPFCKSNELSEFVEVEEDITSVKSVPIEEADSWITQGYKVKEMYAKSVTLVKMEAKA